MENGVFMAKLSEEVLLGDDVSYRELCSIPTLTKKQREKLRSAEKVMLEQKEQLLSNRKIIREKTRPIPKKN
jgi:hypothetical protein